MKLSIKREFNLQTIKGVIFDSWKSDENFFSGLAVNETAEKSISDTISQVKTGLGMSGGRFYVISADEQPIGYIFTIASEIPDSSDVKNFTFISSFCIEKEFRTDEVRAFFLSMCDKLCIGKVLIPLYLKNTRAIRFFEKNGYFKATEGEINGRQTVVLKKERQKEVAAWQLQ